MCGYLSSYINNSVYYNGVIVQTFFFFFLYFFDENVQTPKTVFYTSDLEVRKINTLIQHLTLDPVFKKNLPRDPEFLAAALHIQCDAVIILSSGLILYLFYRNNKKKGIISYLDCILIDELLINVNLV